MEKNNKLIKWINDNFDKQIDRHHYNLEKKGCYAIKSLVPSQVNKKLFNLTLNFTNLDWRVVRTEKYWKEIDKQKSFDEKKYIL